ncbi:hypothetical protein [Pseudomonas sp. LF052]
MEQVEVKGRESSIVLVGEFDPLAMAPHWFVKHGMIPQEDIDETLTIELVYKEVTRFSVANVIVEIRPDVVVLRSTQSSFDYLVHDLAVGVLTSIKSAGVTAVGLNIWQDVVIRDNKLWHQFGDMLAPKEFWSVAVPESGRAGLVNLQMQINKPDGDPGVYNFSVQISELANGMRWSLNNHFDNDKYKGVDRSPYKKKAGVKSDFDPVAVVSAYWQQTIECHSDVIASLLSQVAEGK